MLGRYKYRNRQFAEAISLFQKVDPTSEYYVKSQFFSGVSYVQLRKSVPAVKSFQRVEKAIDDGAAGVEDETRMRDLAYLSMARTYYSASIKLDAETNTPSVNSTKLSAAVKYWNLIETSSEYWLDALFEQSWAYFMAGDYPRPRQHPYDPVAVLPELLLSGGGHPQGGHLLRQLQLRGCDDDRHSEIQQEVPAHQGRAGQDPEAFQGSNQKALLQSF
ncbi:MAG: hypothetical protein R3B07_34615 [Polyangiaceae bacterium]